MGYIGKAHKILERQLGLKSWLKELRDGRQRPQIAAGVIAQAGIEMVLRGQASLLQVDQAMRQAETLGYYGSEREMVVSDSTLARSLTGMPPAELRRMLIRMAGAGIKRGRVERKLASGRVVRIGIIDGSQWGEDLGSVMLLVGQKADTVAGYQMSPGRGHELATSRRLRDEVFGALGSGCVDFLVGDGLYMTVEDLQWCVETGGCHGLVKTTEETLTVIEDAKGIFADLELFGKDIERHEGVDVERGVSYTIQAAKGFAWQGLALKVALVKETALKPEPGRPTATSFWVITTDGNLSGEDMREVAHLRWHIENRAFRRLNQLVGSKRRLTKNAHVREVLLGLWFIGLNILGLLWGWMRPEAWPNIYQTAKKTWLWLAKMFEREVIVAFGLQST